MAISSSLSSLSSIKSAVDSFLSKIKSPCVIHVAFSGGLDSTVLLHALNQAIQNQSISFKLKAIYVDHGLQAESKEWSDHCKQVCNSLNVEFVSLKVDLASFSRKGLEATARTERYKAMAEVIEEVSSDKSFLVTGHHQRDQVETLLLNLFRGAGINGLSAMPFCIKRYTDSGFVFEHYRPLLKVPYTELVKYSEYNQLIYINDQSNQDTQFRRNFVRHDVLKGIESLWPDVQASISNTASHMQEASELLDNFAQKSLADTCFSSCFIGLRNIQQIPWVEQKNTIRFWFKQNWPGVVLSSMHYEWIKNSWLNYSNSQNKNFCYQLSSGELRVYKDRLYYLKNKPVAFSLALKDVENLFGSTFDLFDDFLFKNISLGDVSNANLRSISPKDVVDKKQMKTFFQSHDIPVWERGVWPVLELENGEVVVLGCEQCTSVNKELLEKNTAIKQIGLSHSQRMELMQLL
ncbi:tRNA lysidine(34) synthetase TilS [Thiomicrorhabdus lithotrophica]|uniref:tRNA(Ile)-lysidine synthase n=1 Tax=Thiomicrorhabdus lithotrophica TaxID=2949997 RepID=A0ABY8C6F2_9GAMM|nr:tRNA lysidine(34) synthetase TilS [Thiomicrorhabdus lithotrophica]WEJ61553.1 tRNA lysidine(34) synthetase TilS [Thiomicrorhabdus lithotrophica]